MNLIVPLEALKPVKRSRTAATAAGLKGYTLRCCLVAAKPRSPEVVR